MAVRVWQIEIERVRIRPFALDHSVPYDVILDRLGHWHFHPREWLKKAALTGGTYLLNNPFTFQCFEKHAACAAMQRLGLPVPQTWLLPVAAEAATYRHRLTTARYQDYFDAAEIGNEIGYPLYLKPYDGASGRDVTRVENAQAMTQAYAASGETLLLAQAGIEPHSEFLRTLGIGPQTLTVNYDMTQPMHARYTTESGPDSAREAGRLMKIINAFFLWDFNTCEIIRQDGKDWLIDFTNACPDLALTSLHLFFPGVLKSLLSWLIYCAVTERPMQILPDPAPYFAVADSPRTYEEKLQAYEELADAHFATHQFEDFCAAHLQGLEECGREFTQSSEFDAILCKKVGAVFPAREHEEFIAYFRGLLRKRAAEETAGL